MSDEAIIDAEYVEWRMVKTRSSLQLIFEVPLERQEQVMSALGVPLPNKSNAVAICRLRDKSAAPVAQIEDHRPPAKLAQLAGILCNEGGFRRFLSERTGKDCPDADAAAAVVRFACSVKSRADLDTDEHGAKAFRDIKADYELWLRGMAA